MFEENVIKMNDNPEISHNTFEKRTYTIDEIMDILGICRTTAYNLVKSKEFRSVKVGHSIRISKKSFDTWLDAKI